MGLHNCSVPILATVPSSKRDAICSNSRVWQASIKGIIPCPSIENLKSPNELNAIDISVNVGEIPGDRENGEVSSSLRLYARIFFALVDFFSDRVDCYAPNNLFGKFQ